MKLLIYDVETANTSLSSICQVGWIEIEDDQICEEGVSYINPKCTFNSRNVDVHGITKDDIICAPCFASYYQETLKARMENSVILAHNAGFDLRATMEALEEQHETKPDIKYIDTLKLIKALKRADSYSLEFLAASIGYQYMAHNALEDCRALFKYLEYLRDTLHESSILSMIQNSGIPFEVYHKPVHKSKSTTYHNPGHFQGIVKQECAIFDGLTFCLTGECPQHSREEIECEISKHGGRATTAVSSKTTHLVVGEYDVQKYGEHYISGKHKKCIELNSKGAHIEIIDYNKLYDMMGMTV